MKRHRRGQFQKLAVDSTQNPHVVIGARSGTYNSVVLVHHLYELAYYYRHRLDTLDLLLGSQQLPLQILLFILNVPVRPRTQAAVATASAVCTDPLPPYLFLPSRSSTAETPSPISPVQFRKILHPIFPFLNPFLLLFLSHRALSSVSLSLSVFLVLDLLAQFCANSEKFHTNRAAKSHNSRNNKKARKRAHHRARKWTAVDDSHLASSTDDG